MTSPSTGEGHKFTSNFHLIYAAAGGDGGVCVCVKMLFCLFVYRPICGCVSVCVCAFMYFLLLCVKI